MTKNEEKSLYLNSTKSFTMVFSKASQIPTCNINVHGKILEQMHSFVYLGSQFTSDARCEIRRRIGIAKSAFTSMSVDIKGYMDVRHGQFLSPCRKN